MKKIAQPVVAYRDNPEIQQAVKQAAYDGYKGMYESLTLSGFDPDSLGEEEADMLAKIEAIIWEYVDILP